MAQATMDYDGVLGIAQGFETAGETLQVASRILEAAIMILRATAFISLGATEWLRLYLENIKPKLDKLAATCNEMSGDLRFAVQQHQQSDQSAAPSFG